MVSVSWTLWEWKALFAFVYLCSDCWLGRFCCNVTLAISYCWRPLMCLLYLLCLELLKSDIERC